MGTKLYRPYFILLFCLIFFMKHVNAGREKIILNSLFTYSSYPSIKFALQQIESSQMPMDILLEFNTTEDTIPVSYRRQIYFLCGVFFILV